MPFQKGHVKIGGKVKGTKNRETLIKEERRAMFDALISGEWENIIKKLREKDPKYVADQFMGTAPQKIEHSGEIKTSTPIPKEALDIIEEDLKNKKIDEL